MKPVEYITASALILYICTVNLFAATNLKLNQGLNYNSDSDDGPLISGDNMSDAKLKDDRPNYIIFYQRECYNSKRQAKRTVELYEKFKDKAGFIIVDLDEIKNPDQVRLKNKFYRNYIPHVTVIDSGGKVLYNSAGEVGTDKISKYLENSSDDH